MQIRLGREQRILFLLIINNQYAIRMRCQEEIFGTREPLEMGNWRVVDHTVFVDPSILLRHGLIPDNVTGGGSHHNIQVRRCLGELIDIVAEHVRLGEKHLRQMLFLRWRTQVQPLEGSVDICKREDTVRVAVTQPFRRRLVRDDS